MAQGENAVEITGLADLRRTLRATDREGLKAIREVLKDAAGIVATEATLLAPRRTGRLARSYKPFTRGNTAGVRSRLPYAPVIEYGGTIRPQGVPILFERSAPVTRGLERKVDAVTARLVVGFDAASRRAGWQ